MTSCEKAQDERVEIHRNQWRRLWNNLFVLRWQLVLVNETLAHVVAEVEHE